MGVFFRRRRSVTVGLTAAIALPIIFFFGARLGRPTLATSGGSPYAVPLVVDTNPDPDIVETTITAEPATTDVGNGVIASVLTFNGSVPGPEFRLKVGDTVIVHYKNNLGHPSGIHWHGIELANASDGTPLTQNLVPPGGTFLYKFKISRPGIFWYHPHHHSSTNQVFKGLYGSMIVTDPNEAALEAGGVIPGAAQTKTLVLSDVTVCKAVGSNDAVTYSPSLPHVSGGPLPAQQTPFPVNLCEGLADNPAGKAIDEDGAPRASFAAGDVPNTQKVAPDFTPVNEGQTVLTNGKTVGGRAGTPLFGGPFALPGPGALAPGAQTLDVQAGQGLRLQILNAATTRFFRLILTDNAGVQIPLVRIGGQGGLLDHAVVEGNPTTPPPAGVFDFKYTAGEILIDPGDRADVVAAIPAAATGVLTLWTQDFSRTGNPWANIATVPVAHLNVNGAVTPYTIAAGANLRASIPGQSVEVIGPATVSLLDPGTFGVPKPGLASQDIQLTQVGGTSLGINDKKGTHDFTVDYTQIGHELSARYAAAVGDRLELTVTNTTNAHHPFHLHGFSIQPLDLTKSGSPTYTFPYHEFKDTVDVPKGYTLRFRLRLDDRPLMDGVTSGGAAGRWVFHCHIFFHAVFGMISELNVLDADGNERPHINSNGTSLSGHTGDTLTMHGTFSDPDGDSLSLSASVGTITDDGDGKHWTWTYTAVASELVYVTVSDGRLKDQVAFALDVNTPPVLHLPGPQTADFHDSLTFGISATDANAADTVTLTASGLPAGLAFVDNGDRTGTVAGTLTAIPAVYVATFTANDHVNAPVSGTVTITVTKEETTLTYNGPTAILNAGNVTLSAVLKEDGLVPIAGRSVAFTLGAQACNGVTDVSGTAHCTILVGSVLGSVPVTASFIGDAFYLPSSDHATAVVFAFPTGGAFVVGDTSVAAGGTQTWWSHSWAKENDLSGGGAPSSFKGFAGTVSLPTSTPPAPCGGPWSSSPGNSSSPPATIPSFMGVLVAGTSTKSGNTISGNTASIVVVKVNPGYGPNPGHPGTGTVVAVYCQ
jgi:FtsP/CotA-like multicopper oxidase with cupredoxin domain